MFNNLIKLYDLHKDDEEFHDKFSYWLWAVVHDNPLTQVVLRDELELSQTTFTRLLHRVKGAYFDKKQYSAIMVILTFYHDIDCRMFNRYIETDVCDTKETIKLSPELKLIKDILDYWDDDISFHDYFKDQLQGLIRKIKFNDTVLSDELAKQVTNGLRRNRIRFLYTMALLCGYPNTGIVKQKILQFFVDINNWPMHKERYCDDE